MIKWIIADKHPPQMHEETDSFGEKYMTSKTLLLYTDDREEPVHLGTYEEGRWAVEGVFEPAPKVTHWAYINQPDGHLLM